MISSFRGEYEYLSNFYICGGIWLDGIEYPCVENAYQASKIIITGDTEETNRQRIRLGFTKIKPGQAKRLGRTVEIRKDWEDVKLNIMRDLVKQKFTKNLDLKKKLIQTGEEYIQEGNYWHDNYWGVCECDKCKTILSLNMLGNILIDTRKELLNI